MAQPRVKIVLKTKGNFEQFADQRVRVAALWDGDYGISGSFDDGSWIPSGGYGTRIDTINLLIDGNAVQVPPSSVYLNGKVEDGNVTLWVKSKDSGQTVNLMTLSEGEYGLSGEFSKEVSSITFTAISESGAEEVITLTPAQCFVNGYLNEVSTEAAVQPNDAVIEAAAVAADNIPF